MSVRGIVDLPSDRLAYLAGAVLLAFGVLGLVGRALRRALAGRRPEDVLTVMAASIATVVQTTGMWKFFGNVLHVPGPLRVALFSFIEVAVLASALRARRNVVESPLHTAGIDGKAVWGLTSASAVLSTLDAGSFAEIVFRLVVAGIAAWLWERSLSAERRRRTGRSTNWRLTPERILVFLRLAEPSERTAGDVDRHRRLTRVAVRAMHLRTLRAAGAWAWRVQRAECRLHGAVRAAVEHAGLATDPATQHALMAQIAALYGASDLADITLAAPWGTPGTPVPELYRVSPNLSLERAAAELLAERGGYAEWPDTPKDLLEWLDDQPDPGVPGDEIRVPPAPDPHQVRAAGLFAEEVHRGQVPGIRTIKRRMKLGQDKAQEVREYLSVLADG